MRPRFCIFNLILGLGLTPACSAPQLELSSSPEGTRLYLDGRYATADELRRDLPYYGSMAIDGLPPMQQPGGPAYAGFRHVLRVDPPASRWLFPLDFLIEISSWALTADRPYRAELAAEEIDHSLVIGEAPDLTELRARGKAARIER